MDFSVKAKLGYRVEQETPFVFNVQVQRFSGQTIVDESLQVEPKMPLESWTMPESGNRYVRLIAPGGGFEVSYQATVRVEHPTEVPTQVHEIPPGSLPLSREPGTRRERRQVLPGTATAVRQCHLLLGQLWRRQAGPRMLPPLCGRRRCGTP